MLLDILMFNGLCCLFFQKFQGVREPIAYKVLLKKHNECNPENDLLVLSINEEAQAIADKVAKANAQASLRSTHLHIGCKSHCFRW